MLTSCRIQAARPGRKDMHTLSCSSGGKDNVCLALTKLSKVRIISDISLGVLLFGHCPYDCVARSATERVSPRRCGRYVQKNLPYRITNLNLQNYLFGRSLWRKTVIACKRPVATAATVYSANIARTARFTSTPTLANSLPSSESGALMACRSLLTTPNTAQQCCQ